MLYALLVNLSTLTFLGTVETKEVVLRGGPPFDYRVEMWYPDTWISGYLDIRILGYPS
jgi:hypothetical protein